MVRRRAVDIRERQEFRQQCSGPAIRKQRTHLRDDALVFGRASVRHDFGDRVEYMAAGHRASAGRKARCANLHRSEHGQQAPSADVFEQPLGPAMGAEPPLAAVFLRMCLNEMAPRSSERPSASVSPTVMAEHSAALLPPALTSRVRTVPSLPVSSTMNLHFIPLPRVPVTGRPHTPPGLRRSLLAQPFLISTSGGLITRPSRAVRRYRPIGHWPYRP
jgi:hypothetical protein